MCNKIPNKTSSSEWTEMDWYVCCSAVPSCPLMADFNIDFPLESLQNERITESGEKNIWIAKIYANPRKCFCKIPIVVCWYKVGARNGLQWNECRSFLAADNGNCCRGKVRSMSSMFHEDDTKIHSITKYLLIIATHRYRLCKIILDEMKSFSLVLNSW